MAYLKTFTGTVHHSSATHVNVVSASVASQRGGFVGRTVVGAVIAGPVGAVIGAATTKNKNTAMINFEVVCKDGTVEQGFATEKEYRTFAEAVRRDAQPRAGSGKLVFIIMAAVAVLFVAAQF